MKRVTAIPETVTVHVPFRFVKRGGRKEMVLPEATSGAPTRSKSDSTAVKALARAFRWKRMIDSGAFATVSDLAAHEKIASSYMTRVLRLTLLAPEIVEGVMEGRGGVGLAELLKPFPAEWARQTYIQREDAPIRFGAEELEKSLLL